jgi:hypothetical protein
MSFLLRPWREHLPQFVNLISPACALREHRNDMRVVPFLPVCASGEHKRPTAFVFPLPACALREHRNDMRVVPSLLVWALGEHKRPTGQPNRLPRAQGLTSLIFHFCH